jgi:hypothetical protein
MDSSSWTLSTVDIMVQNTETTFRNPLTLPSLVIPQDPVLLDYGKKMLEIKMNGDANINANGAGGTDGAGTGAGGALSTLRVWELGVHASLSAEPLNLWAKLIFGKFQFANIISEQYPPWLPEKWSTLYGENFDKENMGEKILYYSLSHGLNIRKFMV